MKTQQLDPSIVLGDFARQLVQENFQKIVDRQKAVLEDKDPEPLHQMRVGMRRLRVAVRVFDGAILLPKAVSASAIGKIARILGKTRDLDVLRQNLLNRDRSLLQKSERAKFAEVLEYLHQKRTSSFLKLQKTLSGDRYRKLKESIAVWLEQPKYSIMGSLTILPMLSDLILPSICQLLLHSGWLVGTTIELGKAKLMSLEDSGILHEQLEQFGKVLHSLRKQVKGDRYRAEFFATFYDDSFLERIEELKQIQDILGELQDNAVLRRFFESKLKIDLAGDLPTIDRQIKDERAILWQKWQPIQQRYLSSEFRQSWRLAVIN
jgi:CHAD domain-containing protein